MPETVSTPSGPSVEVPILLVAELQDSLLTVVHDLKRLDDLLSQSMSNLMDRFTSVNSHLASTLLKPAEDIEAARYAVQSAVIELQFQDIASQLIAHASKTLQGCAYRLAAESMGAEDGDAVPFVDEMPNRPNPVTQAQMDAGSIELF
ncbi:MAG: hypothetical protein WCO22_13575 [Betaproteobacteria bacterium]|jgi:hypothetical protein